MNERDFIELDAAYRRTYRSTWPWWWGVGMVLAALAAFILILCAGPAKAQAEEPAPVEVCKAIEGHLLEIAKAGVRSALIRVDYGLSLAGVDADTHTRIVSAVNSPQARSVGEQALAIGFLSNLRAVLLAFGCREGG